MSADFGVRLAPLQLAPLQYERPDPPDPPPMAPPGAPQPPFTFDDLFRGLPGDYSGRFGGVSPVVTPGYGYGLRGIPLPFKYDFRVTLVAHPLYYEYGVFGRAFDTSFALGRFQNDDGGATEGVGTIQAIHNPDTGAQAALLLQDHGRISKVSAGYAWRLDDFRPSTEAGYAWEGDFSGPYVRGSLNWGHTYEQRGDFGLLRETPSATVRSYLYPVQLAAQTSADLALGVNYKPVPDFSVNLFHFERFVDGPDGVPDFNLSRYSQSSLDAYYTPAARLGPLEFRGAAYHLTRIWLDHYFSINELSATGRLNVVPEFAVDFTPRYDFTYHNLGLRGSLLLRLDGFPSAFGPSFEYVLNPAGNSYSFGVVFAGK